MLDAQDGKPVVVCDVGALAATDIGSVDALCRLLLIARQLGCDLRVERATDELRELLALAGLDDVIRCEPRSGGVGARVGRRAGRSARCRGRR